MFMSILQPLYSHTYFRLPFFIQALPHTVLSLSSVCTHRPAPVERCDVRSREGRGGLVPSPFQHLVCRQTADPSCTPKKEFLACDDADLRSINFPSARKAHRGKIHRRTFRRRRLSRHLRVFRVVRPTSSSGKGPVAATPAYTFDFPTSRRRTGNDLQRNTGSSSPSTRGTSHTRSGCPPSMHIPSISIDAPPLGTQGIELGAVPLLHSLRARRPLGLLASRLDRHRCKSCKRKIRPPRVRDSWLTNIPPSPEISRPLRSTIGP